MAKITIQDECIPTTRHIAIGKQSNDDNDSIRQSRNRAHVASFGVLMITGWQKIVIRVQPMMFLRLFVL